MIVYFLVFGAGTLYILRLMEHAPHPGETEEARAPIRTAGITPSPSVRRPGGVDPDADGRGGALMDLTIVWALILAFIVAMYVVMDGFDLGIGILFPFFRVGKERDMAMNAIAPVWDGNETWLILGGNGLIAAFPVAYAIILPALYAPLIAMLLGLIFRGVAFEFRWRDPGHRRWWDAGFFSARWSPPSRRASRSAPSCRGSRSRACLCRRLVGMADAVQPACRFQPCPRLRLGACWLIWKTEGPVHEDARRHARVLLPALLVALGLVSLATPFLETKYYERWFDTPGLFVTIPMPLLVAGAALWPLARAEARPRCHAFLLVLGLFGLSMAGSPCRCGPTSSPGGSPSGRRRHPRDSQVFMLVGAALLIPLILAYTAWSYWVFRGKVGEEGWYQARPGDEPAARRAPLEAPCLVLHLVGQQGWRR